MHAVADGMREDQVERKEAPFVRDIGGLLHMRVGAAGLVEFTALAVDEIGIVATLENRVAHPDARIGKVPGGPHIRTFIAQLLVPNALRARSFAPKRTSH